MKILLLLIVYIHANEVAVAIAPSSAVLYRLVSGQTQPVSTSRIDLIPTNGQLSSRFPYRISSSVQDVQLDPTKFQGLISGRDRVTIQFGLKGKPDSDLVASVDACSLIESGFRDKVTLVCDSKGNVIFAGYSVNTTAPLGERCSASSSTKIKLHTEFDIFPIEEGPLPNHLEMLYKVPEPPKEDVSVFRKYWYIFIPVGLMLIVSAFG